MKGLREVASVGDDEQVFLRIVDGVAADHVEPVAREIDDGRLPPSVLEVLAETGILLLAGSSEQGGGGADVVTLVVALQALARSSASVASIVADHHAAAVALGGLDPALLPGDLGAPPLVGFVDGTRGACLELAASEGTYQLTGQAEVSNWMAGSAAIAIVFGGAIGLVGVLEREAPGVVVADAPLRTGLRGAPAALISFSSAAVECRPAPDRVEHACMLGDLATAAMALGVAERAVDEATRHVTDRRQFGRALVGFPAVREMLEAMETRVRQSAALVYAAAGAAGARSARGWRPCGHDVAAAAVATCIEGVQLHGGYGYMRDAVIERLMRDALSLRSRSGIAWQRR